jgi:DNA-binding MarR family transcriptional regulator
MITVKATRDKFFTSYLNWLDPILRLSKGEVDILAALLTLHYAHRHYDKEVLASLLTAPETMEAIRKKMKINAKLFKKLVKSLEEKGLLEAGGLNPKLTNYPKDGKFRLFIAFELTK